MKSKTEKVDISFNGKWSANEVDSIVFKDVSGVSMGSSVDKNKAKKKGKAKKKKKN